MTEIDDALLLRYFRAGPRYTSYPTAPEWSDEIGPEQLIERLRRADDEGADSPLSLYFHLPFCRQLCLYCGCSVVITSDQQKADRYSEQLAREMDLVAAQLPRRRRVSQLHLGGGTPTFFDAAQLERLWRSILDRFDVLPAAEIALEIDPVVTSTDQLTLLRELGFNRVSMGIQDFTPEVQQYVRRVQSVEQTRALYDHARALGYTGISFDLIYGLPKQSESGFDETLSEVLAMRPDRAAVFSYAHVPWIRPHQRKLDESLMPSAEAKLRLFKLAHDRFLAAGYEQIGMDHFALPEDELAVARRARRLERSFQGYTVRPASALLGFGVTSISEVAGCYAQNLKGMADYEARLGAGGLATTRGWALSPEDELRRAIIHGIMCNFAVDLEETCRRFDFEPGQLLARDLELLAEVEEHGLVERDGWAIEATPLGRLLIRNIAMVFDPYLRESPREGLYSKTI